MVVRFKVTNPEDVSERIEKEWKTRKFNVKSFINKGYASAIKKSPYDKGNVRRALTKHIYSKSRGAIILKYPHQKRKEPRPYHLWMHNIGKYRIKHHIKTGEGDFMWKVAEEISQMINDEKNRK